MIFQEAFSRMLPAVSQHVSAALLHFLWQGTLVALAAAMILRLLRDPLTTEAEHEDGKSLPPERITRAGARYLISCFALAVMAVLPLVNLAVLETPFENVDGFDSGMAANARHVEPVAGGLDSAVPNALPGGTNQSAVAKSEPIPPVLSSWTSAARGPFLQCFFWVWIVGVALLSAWHVVGWNLSQHVRHRGTVPSGEIPALVRRIAGQLGIERTIDVRQTLERTGPVVIGWIKPALILPASMLTNLAPRELEALLAHELAHVKRHDYLVNLIQAVVETLLFFHPAVWWVSRRIRAEREFCADDAAIRLCADRDTYVRSLVSLAGLARGSVAHAVAATGGSLTVRAIRALYQTDRRLQTPRLAQRSALAGVSATACLVILLTAMARGQTDDAASSKGKADASDVPVVASEKPKGAGPIKTMRGDNYLIIPWKKTDLQMCFGSAGNPKEDCKAYVLIDGNSLYIDRKLDREKMDWAKLARQLRPLSDPRRGVVVFHVFNFNLQAEMEETRSLGPILQEFGKEEAGFNKAYWTQTYAGTYAGERNFWDMIDAVTKQMDGREEGDEPGVGNDLVKAYPVRTFLSCLLSGNSDCVVEIIPRLNKSTGKSLPPEIRRAILDTVPKVATHGRKKVSFRVNYTKEAKETVEWFQTQGADELARALGFQDGSCSGAEYD